MNSEKTISKKSGTKIVSDKKNKKLKKVVEKKEQPKIVEKKEQPKIVEKKEQPKIVDKKEQPKIVDKKEQPKLVVKENTITETNITETNITETNLDTQLEKHVLSDNNKKDPIIDIINSLLIKFESIEKDSRNSKNELKKALKLYLKKSFKNKRKYDPNRTPSGFAKPSLISEELCKFLNRPAGTKMARTDVTKEVNNYIKSKNLQNPENKKKITPDDTLIKLLKITDNDTLTYFSMQKYLKDHFPKETSKETEIPITT
jgi:chromatin remodeling complex protein RSC6